MDPAGHRKKKGTVGRKVLERGRLGPQIANLADKERDLVRKLVWKTVIQRYGFRLLIPHKCLHDRIEVESESMRSLSDVIGLPIHCCLLKLYTDSTFGKR